jgi:hypothetical protein
MTTKCEYATHMNAADQYGRSQEVIVSFWSDGTVGWEKAHVAAKAPEATPIPDSLCGRHGCVLLPHTPIVRHSWERD